MTDVEFELECKAEQNAFSSFSEEPYALLVCQIMQLSQMMGTPINVVKERLANPHYVPVGKEEHDLIAAIKGWFSWTTRTPTEAGWYWWRKDSKSEPEIIDVKLFCGWVIHDYDCYAPLESDSKNWPLAQWSGPIKQPKG